jgi:hypothetical protein
VNPVKIPENYYIIFVTPDDLIASAAPLCPPSAHEIGNEHTFVANDAEALSLARVVYADMCHFRVHLVYLLLNSCDRVLVAAQPSRMLGDDEGKQVGVNLVDAIPLELSTMRVVAPLSGVPTYGLPEQQCIDVGCPTEDVTDGRDVVGTTRYMENGMAEHRRRYALLTGAYPDRFAAIADKMMWSMIDFTILTNVWFESNPDLHQYARTYERPAVMEEIVAASDAVNNASIYLARASATLAFRLPTLFVQDMLGDQEHDWDALLDDGSEEVAS